MGRVLPARPLCATDETVCSLGSAAAIGFSYFCVDFCALRMLSCPRGMGEFTETGPERPQSTHKDNLENAWKSELHWDTLGGPCVMLGGSQVASRRKADRRVCWARPAHSATQRGSAR